MQVQHKKDKQLAYFTAEDAEENKDKKNKDEVIIFLLKSSASSAVKKVLRCIV